MAAIILFSTIGKCALAREQTYPEAAKAASEAGDHKKSLVYWLKTVEQDRQGNSNPDMAYFWAADECMLMDPPDYQSAIKYYELSISTSDPMYLPLLREKLGKARLALRLAPPKTLESSSPSSTSNNLNVGMDISGNTKVPITAKPSRDISQSDKPVADKWALVIGISKFANSQYNLKYAAKDAQDFYNYLVTDGRLKKDHVLLLLNENATRRNIMAAFGNKFLPAVTRDGDLVAIYVSTHGTPSNKDAGNKNYLVAYDTECDALYETGVDMDQLYQRVKDGVKTDRALIVMDTCYSGAGVPGSRGINDYGNFNANEIAQGFGRLVMSSSSPNERSWESKITNNGVFTKYLLSGLKLSNGNVKTAFQKLKDDVGWEVQSAFNQQQHPQLGGQWEGKELILSAPASAPRSVLNPDLLKMMNLQQVKPTK